MVSHFNYVLTQSTSICLPPHTLPYLRREATHSHTDHTKLHYLPELGNRSAPSLRCSSGGSLTSPSLVGHPHKGTPQGDEADLLPSQTALSLKSPPRVLWSSSAPSQYKGLCGLGKWQVQSVMLLNYLGSELKQWPQYLYSLQSSLSSTLWPGLCTFFSNISFFKKWEGKSSKFNFKFKLTTLQAT